MDQAMTDHIIAEAGYMLVRAEQAVQIAVEKARMLDAKIQTMTDRARQLLDLTNRVGHVARAAQAVRAQQSASGP